MLATKMESYIPTLSSHRLNNFSNRNRPLGTVILCQNYLSPWDFYRVVASFRVFQARLKRNW